MLLTCFFAHNNHAARRRIHTQRTKSSQKYILQNLTRNSMFSLGCCGGCCLIFSVVGVIFLLIFAGMVAFHNVSMEEMWEKNFYDIDRARKERVRPNISLQVCYHLLSLYTFLLDIFSCSFPHTTDNWPPHWCWDLRPLRSPFHGMHWRRQSEAHRVSVISLSTRPAGLPWPVFDLIPHGSLVADLSVSIGLVRNRFNPGTTALGDPARAAYACHFLTPLVLSRRRVRTTRSFSRAGYGGSVEGGRGAVPRASFARRTLRVPARRPCVVGAFLRRCGPGFPVVGRS